MSIIDHNYVLGPLLVPRKDEKVSIWQREMESPWLAKTEPFLGLAEGLIFKGFSVS